VSPDFGRSPAAAFDPSANSDPPSFVPGAGERGLDHMEGLLDELRGLRRGHVTVAAVQAAAADLFPRILATFRRKHPRITFTCRFVGSAEVAEQVASGEADVGISFNVAPSSALRQLIAVPLPFGRAGPGISAPLP
jgi:DNA-binding transcriptional LysR family regulator